MQNKDKLFIFGIFLLFVCVILFIFVIFFMTTDGGRCIIDPVNYARENGLPVIVMDLSPQPYHIYVNNYSLDNLSVLKA